MVGRGIVENSGGLVRSSLTLRMTPRPVDGLKTMVSLGT